MGRKARGPLRKCGSLATEGEVFLMRENTESKSQRTDHANECSLAFLMGSIGKSVQK
jgi:hypothetical protein